MKSTKTSNKYLNCIQCNMDMFLRSTSQSITVVVTLTV